MITLSYYSLVHILLHSVSVNKQCQLLQVWVALWQYSHHLHDQMYIAGMEELESLWSIQTKIKGALLHVVLLLQHIVCQHHR